MPTHSSYSVAVYYLKGIKLIILIALSMYCRLDEGLLVCVILHR